MEPKEKLAQLVGVKLKMDRIYQNKEPKQEGKEEDRKKDEQIIMQP